MSKLGIALSRLPRMERCLAEAAAFVVAGSLIWSPAAQASSSGPGVILSIGIEDGKAFFYTSASRSNDTPSCHTIPGRWVFDAATPKGQAMLSFLESQFASGKPILVVGYGVCSDWPDTETVRYIWSAT